MPVYTEKERVEIIQKLAKTYPNEPLERSRDLDFAGRCRSIQERVRKAFWKIRYQPIAAEDLLVVANVRLCDLEDDIQGRPPLVQALMRSTEDQAKIIWRLISDHVQDLATHFDETAPEASEIEILRPLLQAMNRRMALLTENL